MKPKFCSVALILTFSLAPAMLLAQSPTVPEQRSLVVDYVDRMVGPASVARSAAAGGFDQALTNPYEWGGGIEGFGRRFASALGTHVVRSTIHFTVGKLLHEELDYRASGKQGFGPRLKYALVSTVVTRKTTTHKRTVAVGEIAGITGSGFISRLWHPVAYHTVSSGFAATGVGFAVEAGMNVLHEFWPEIRHPHSHAARAHLPQPPDAQAVTAPDPDQQIETTQPDQIQEDDTTQPEVNQ
jgi:hypothetical protein